MGGWQLSTHLPLPLGSADVGRLLAASGRPTSRSRRSPIRSVAYDDGVTMNQNGNPAIFASTTEAANWKPMLPGEVGTRAAVRLDDFYNTDLVAHEVLPHAVANHRLQFRAEAFNAFNNVNYTNVVARRELAEQLRRVHRSGAGARDAVRASLRVLGIVEEETGMKRLLLALAAFGPLALFVYHEPASRPSRPTPTQTEFFEKNVRPVLDRELRRLPRQRRRRRAAARLARGACSRAASRARPSCRRPGQEPADGGGAAHRRASRCRSAATS